MSLTDRSKFYIGSRDKLDNKTLKKYTMLITYLILIFYRAHIGVYYDGHAKC